MAEDTIFDQANQSVEDNPNPGEYLQMYVGEGKKYQSVEDLAKAYFNADKFIPELKNDLASLREFTQEQFKKQAESLSTPQRPNAEDSAGNNSPPQAPPKAGEEKDLSELIRQELDNQNRTKTAEQNAVYTEKVMITHYGSRENAVKAVQEKAAELEVNPQFLADLAFSSPKAYFQTMGINPEETPRSTNTPSSVSHVNPLMIGQTHGQPKQGTYAHYESLRKSDSKKYWSASVQKAMMADAMRLGDDFFKR